MNLLKETISILKENNKTPQDIEWVGILNKCSFTWEQFVPIADRKYDNGFGLPEVNEGLIVVGKDFWLERHEFDGAEWWEFKTLPVMPQPVLVAPKIFNY